MKEHPIIMSGASIRAILDGRKSQTRRVIRPQPWQHQDGRWMWTPKGYVKQETFDDIAQFLKNDHALWAEAVRNPWGILQFCPYGAIGDRLWVRETWKHPVPWRPTGPIGEQAIEHQEQWYLNLGAWFYVWYKATSAVQGTELPVHECIAYDKRYLGDAWRSPIYMPKFAARIWLEVVSVRAEQVHEISPDDIYAEGYPREMIARVDPLLWFRDLWDKLNLKRGYGWETNPWVWVVSFKVVS